MTDCVEIITIPGLPPVSGEMISRRYGSRWSTHAEFRCVRTLRPLVVG